MSIYQKLFNLEKRKKEIINYKISSVSDTLKDVSFDYVSPSVEYKEENGDLFNIYYKGDFFGLFNYESIIKDLVSISLIIYRFMV